MKTVSANKWTRICENSPEGALLQMLASPQLEVVYAAQAELARRAAEPPCTNLYKWRKEMAEGKRDAYVFDELWRKACEEASVAENQTRISPRAGVA